MKPSLQELKAEKNIHGAILTVLCITAFSICGLVFSIIIFPVAGIIQITYAFVKLGNYPESRRRSYVYVASAWMLCIVLIGFGAFKNVFPDSTNDTLLLDILLGVLIMILLIIGPIVLSGWAWRIARGDYHAAQQDPNYPNVNVITAYDDLLDS